MWDQLPLDLLSHIFSFLPPDSLACCISSCKPWRSAALSAAAPSPVPSAPWLLAVPARAASCHAYNPLRNRWHSLPLRFLPFPIRPVAPINSLLLCKLATSPAAPLRLLLCNPFTRQFRLLPALRSPRTNPAIGIVTNAAAASASASFCIFVAGGASGASYEQNVEVYDSDAGGWSPAGAVPMEFAVRLTVWTPNESVAACDGAIYWMTSARAYSVVGYDVMSREWREVKAPMADRLEWAALARRGGGRVGLVGGSESGEGFVWELRERDEWVVVGAVPAARPGLRPGPFRSDDISSGVKCAGGGEVVYLFRDIGSEMLVGDLSRDRVEWSWVDGCCGSSPEANAPVKALLVHPSLSPLSTAWK